MNANKSINVEHVFNYPLILFQVEIDPFGSLINPESILRFNLHYLNKKSIVINA